MSTIICHNYILTILTYILCIAEGDTRQILLNGFIYLILVVQHYYDIMISFRVINEPLTEPKPHHIQKPPCGGKRKLIVGNADYLNGMTHFSVTRALALTGFHMHLYHLIPLT